MFGWPGKLDRSFFQAPRFYGVMIVCTTIACALAFAGIKPIQLLFVSSIAGGVATPVSLVFMLLAASGADIRLRIAGWATTAIVTAAAAIFLYQSLTGHA